MIQCIIIAIFFQKITKTHSAVGGLGPIPSGAWGLCPQTPSMMRLSYACLLHTSPNLDIRTFDFWFKNALYRKSWSSAKHRLRLLIFQSLSHKISSFENFLMTSLHVICALSYLQLKILVMPMLSAVENALPQTVH